MEEYLRKIVALLESQSKAILTLEEAIAYTNIGKNRMLELINKHDTDFPFFRNGRKILINKIMLDEWLNKVTAENRVI
jgi:excisionase family DNA binding protein